MTWKHVSDALPGWLRAEIELMKSGASAEPAPSYREVITKEEAGEIGDFSNCLHMQAALRTRRFMATARPTSEPHRSAVVINLDVWKSSRDARGGGRASRPISARPEGNGCC